MKFSILILLFNLVYGIGISQQNKDNKYKYVFTPSEFSETSTIYEIVKTNENCQIISFEFTLVSKKENSIITFKNTSSTLNQEIQYISSQCCSGDKVYIDKIKSVADCLRYQKNGNLKFVIEIHGFFVTITAKRTLLA